MAEAAEAREIEMATLRTELDAKHAAAVEKVAEEVAARHAAEIDEVQRSCVMAVEAEKSAAIKEREHLLLQSDERITVLVRRVRRQLSALLPSMRLRLHRLRRLSPI